MSVHEEKKDFKCDLCDSTSGNLKWQNETVHDNNNKKIKCDIFKKTFGEMNCLKTHVSYVYFRILQGLHKFFKT